jgi:hypothetical protein
MTDKRIPWSCMIYDWTEAGLGRTGKMHDRRLWTVTEGWDDFVRICFPPQYSRVDQAWRLRENNGNGIFRCRVKTTSFVA